jgi:hypothetical protein
VPCRRAQLCIWDNPTSAQINACVEAQTARICETFDCSTSYAEPQWAELDRCVHNAAGVTCDEPAVDCAP